jgi:DNA modification methylase
MSLELRIGDVFDRMAEIPDGSIDLIVTSPPFLALRSYLPADHPDKAKEIGSEATPAAFIDTLLALSAEWGRVLAPHGSLCVELGDTYTGSKAQDDGTDPTTTARRPSPAHGRRMTSASPVGRSPSR